MFATAGYRIEPYIVQKVVDAVLQNKQVTVLAQFGKTPAPGLETT